MTFREKAYQYFKENGYFKLTQEERVKSNEECMRALAKIPKNNYEEGKKLLNILRGG